MQKTKRFLFLSILADIDVYCNFVNIYTWLPPLDLSVKTYYRQIRIIFKQKVFGVFGMVVLTLNVNVQMLSFVKYEQ